MSGHWIMTGFEPDEEGLREALCTLDNGYMAARGHSVGREFPN